MRVRSSVVIGMSVLITSVVLMVLSSHGQGTQVPKENPPLTPSMLPRRRAAFP